MAKPVELLENDTIVEAIAEVRFAKGRDENASVLPALVFNAFKDRIEKISDLPASKVPVSILEGRPELAYSPYRALDGRDWKILIGPRSVGIAVAKPYPGWKSWKPRILEVIKTCLDSGLLGEPERLALKYSNLLDVGADATDLSQMSLRFELPGLQRRGTGLQLRAEVDHGGCVNVITVASSTTVTVEAIDFTGEGVLLTVDSIKFGPIPDFQGRIDTLLEEVHTAEKEVFFSLLEEATVDKLRAKSKSKGK